MIFQTHMLWRFRAECTVCRYQLSNNFDVFVPKRVKYYIDCYVTHGGNWLLLILRLL